MKYTPEIGQACFGQESKEYELTPFLEGALDFISNKWNEVLGSKLDNPFSNTGASWECEVFKVEAYSWNDEYEQPYNFKYKDIEVSWYKYFGRGMSCNKEVKDDYVYKMITDCITALNTI